MDALGAVQQIAEALKALFEVAFRDPSAGLVWGGLLIVAGRAGRALTAAGIVVVAYSLLTLVFNWLGIKWP